MKKRYYKGFEYNYIRSNFRPYVLTYKTNDGKTYYKHFDTKKEMTAFCDSLINEKEGK